ncbi:hypothetical protein EVG20_g9531 [Dentipellis fragilis]|uniref:Cytochrome P450 n=1 Tax=Dentipellis fragilis TaxID=205917 RepID=A0A4Y9XYW7_9AGAM|nr:hypothetical protein EVG20_g9531 [Dentipellis fragilis]
MDTTSSALSHILYLLAENQDVQDKLRDELIKAQEACDALDYEGLHNLPYMDAVCRETLRLYPPIPFVTRTTRADVVLPWLGTPLTATDGSKVTEIPIVPAPLARFGQPATVTATFNFQTPTSMGHSGLQLELAQSRYVPGARRQAIGDLNPSSHHAYSVTAAAQPRAHVQLATHRSAAMSTHDSGI